VFSLGYITEIDNMTTDMTSPEVAMSPEVNNNRVLTQS